jgi:hypothetical protein
MAPHERISDVDNGHLTESQVRESANAANAADLMQ